MQWTYDETVIEEVPCLRIKGRVVEQGSSKLNEILTSLCLDNGPKVVVDISEIEFIDSHGLGQFFYFNKLLKDQKRELVILNMSQSNESYMSKLIEITDIQQVIRVAFSESEV